MAGPNALQGKTVVVTRAKAQADELVRMLEDLGAIVLAFPTIETVPPDSWEPADTAIRNLDLYDWVVFSSANGVERFFERLAVADKDTRALAGASIAAVGPATAARCEAYGLRPDFIPDDHRGEGLAAGFAERGVGEGSRVLLPRPEEGRNVFPDAMRERGARVDVVPVYRTVTGPGDAAVLERLKAGSVDVVTFTSPSTLKGFLALTGEEGPGILARSAVAVIGPVSRKAADRLGVRVDVEASPYTAPALVEALAAHFGGGTHAPRSCWAYDADDGEE